MEVNGGKRRRHQDAKSLEEYKELLAETKQIEHQKKLEKHLAIGLILAHKRRKREEQLHQQQTLTTTTQNTIKKEKTVSIKEEAPDNQYNTVCQQQQPYNLNDIMCSTNYTNRTLCSEPPSTSPAPPLGQKSSIIPKFEIIPEAGGDEAAMMEDIITALCNKNHKFKVIAKAGPISIEIQNDQ